MTRAKKAKQQRRQAQVKAPPPVRGQGPSRRRQASPRVLIAAAAVVVLAGIGIGVGVAVSGGGSSALSKAPLRGSLVNALPGAQQVQKLFNGIPQHGTVLGSPSAPVTLREWVDLQCPYCQAFETTAMPTIVDRYVRTGKVKVDVRIIAFIGPDSQRGRLAALAAGEQDRLFNFAELLYQNQGTENTGWLSDGMVEKAAASIPGLYVHVLLDTRNSSRIKNQTKQLDKQQAAANVTRTPTILVGKSGGSLHEVALSSPSDEQSVAAAIQSALG